ncbi:MULTISPECIES: hypothetical protein [Sporosarcina]|uniref:Transcription initiation factor TFIIIB n=2 Tax=Sporosarcina newyorkensis TaxID=759851 RepID=A0A1T4YY54_9BACL|nr:MULTISPECIES: hypothetical protein [Sporosarcina]EGQ24037.1 hypothetical protein HMPREF9372_2619 [Sporosarcina newyorkensis 2681]MBY0223388.1 transcription initiation factor TFIIIB [Sporosarcina aquimarina]SKB06730.1 hypothetical protein SAMN04244570_0226 [Sporosarcina newyorkensis]
MQPTNVKACTQCGGSAIGKGVQSGYASVTTYKKMGIGHKLIHLICTDCGWVLGSYVENPRVFKKTIGK